jgi:aryl sulfotransferase
VPGLVRYRNWVQDSARWRGFVFRPDDIVISTPPKCGTTWTQMICALLIQQRPTLDTSLDLISPWLDMESRSTIDVFADLDAQQHRRFIKTHTPLDGLPYADRVTYLCVGRDPRDVARSMDNHHENMDDEAFLGARQQAVGLDGLAELVGSGPPARPPTEIERFWRWVDDPTPARHTGSSLLHTLHHLGTFWSVRGRSNIVLLNYDDLKADLEGEMRSLADRLGLAVSEERWPELVAAAGFEQMRDNADHLVPDSTHGIWHDNQRFFHQGESGRWRELLDEDDLRRYATRVAELAPPDLAGWAHHGPLTV